MGPHVCPWWAAYAFDNPLRHVAHRPAEMLRRYVRPGTTALDIGCGMGFFSIGMARLVGPGGRVLAVDLQPQMLAAVRRRAVRVRLATRIETRRCRADDIAVRETVEFALAFWVVHEVPDARRLFDQVRAVLAPTGCLLMAEPPGHVPAAAFEAEVEAAREAGLVPVRRPYVALSRAVVLAPSRVP